MQSRITIKKQIEKNILKILTVEREETALSKNSVEELFGGGFGVFPKPLYRPP